MKYIAVFLISILLGMYCGAILMKEHTVYSRHYCQVLHYYSVPWRNSFAEPLDLPCFHGTCAVTNRVTEIDGFVDFPLQITSCFQPVSICSVFQNSALLSYLRTFEPELRSVDKDTRLGIRTNIVTILANDPWPAGALAKYMMTYRNGEEVE